MLKTVWFGPPSFVRSDIIASLNYMKRSTFPCFLEGDDSVVPLVEVLERIAQLHQVVLSSTHVSTPTLFK